MRWSALFIIVFCASPTLAEEWQSRQGAYTEFFYKDTETAKEFNGKLSMHWLRYQPPRREVVETSVAEAVVGKMDTIWVNVEKILNIYPRGPLVGVFAYDNNEFSEKYKGLNRIPAFYAKYSKRVVANAAKVKTNVLAHEFAHAIIDMHMGGSVPDTVHEILARYVDAHLYD